MQPILDDDTLDKTQTIARLRNVLEHAKKVLLPKTLTQLSVGLNTPFLNTDSVPFERELSNQLSSSAV